MTELLLADKNRLLSSLSIEVQNRLIPKLEAITATAGTVLYDAGVDMRYVYFPIDSIVSLIHTMKSGATAGSSMVGNEGMVGIPVFMGGNNTQGQAVTITSGTLYRLTAQRLKNEFNHPDARLHMLLLRYSQVQITQIAQTAACNRHHNINQQLCCCLLMSLDRLPNNDIPMTQELIAHMLGVRREGVTEAARKLQKLGVIDYHRGHIVVLDRAKLEEMACECYVLVKNETNRLLPDPTRPKLATVHRCKNVVAAR